MAILHVLDFIPTHFAYASLDASRDLLSRSRSLHPRSLPPRLRDYVTFLQKLHRQIAHGEPPDPCVWKSLDEIKPFSSGGAGDGSDFLANRPSEEERDARAEAQRERRAVVNIVDLRCRSDCRLRKWWHDAWP